MNPLAFFGDKRIFALLIVVVLALYFIVVNNPTLRGSAQVYLVGALIVLAGLPMLKLLMR